MKTVREVAEELNISRQAVYSKLTVEFKENFTTIKNINNRDTLVIGAAGIEELRKNMYNLDSQVDASTVNQVDNQLIEILRNQLEVKDQQIIELNQRLKEAQDLNKNSQILIHRQQDETKMLESKNRFSFQKWFRRDE